MAVKPSIFLGSASEHVAVLDVLQELLENEARVNSWRDGVFRFGEGTLESLTNRLDDYDFAVMLVTPVDLVTTRGRRYDSPRDNVLFELGLFMGRLGRSRAIILSEDGIPIKLPSDLAGVTRACFQRTNPLEDGLRYACTKILSHIAEEGNRQVGAMLPVQPPPIFTERDFRIAAKLIRQYMIDHEYNMITYGAAQEWVNPAYDEEFCKELMKRYPLKFGPALLSDGPGICIR